MRVRVSVYLRVWARVCVVRVYVRAYVLRVFQHNSRPSITDVTSFALR